MNNVDLLYPFVGKTVVDIAEYDEDNTSHTFIKITFDDDSCICFPRTGFPSFWFKYED